MPATRSRPVRRPRRSPALQGVAENREGRSDGARRRSLFAPRAAPPSRAPARVAACGRSAPPAAPPRARAGRSARWWRGPTSASGRHVGSMVHSRARCRHHARRHAGRAERLGGSSKAWRRRPRRPVARARAQLSLSLRTPRASQLRIRVRFNQTAHESSPPPLSSRSTLLIQQAVRSTSAGADMCVCSSTCCGR